MLTFKFAIFLVTVGGAFVGWAGYTVEMARRRRKATARLERGLGAFREGEEATVVGTVRRPKQPLIAPISGKDCVAYDARVRSGNINFPSGPEVTRVRVMPFELDTPSGVVRVEADHAELLFEIVPMIPRRVEREAEFAKECGVIAALADIHCVELCVEVGADVAVHGVVSIDLQAPGSNAGYRDGGTRYKLGPHPEHHLTIGKPP